MAATASCPAGSASCTAGSASSDIVNFIDLSSLDRISIILMFSILLILIWILPIRMKG